jgi:hypothetical protein
MEAKREEVDPPEPRWPAIVAVLAVGGLYAALPPAVAAGPKWLASAVIFALLLPTVLSHRRGSHRWNQIFGHLLSGAMTVFLLWSLVLLIRALPERKEQPITLLRSAAALWVTTVLVFALWYWRLDAGGPHGRAGRVGHPTGSFLFPQMVLTEQEHSTLSDPGWSPRFIDYLFVAFTTSTAFSPTDTPVLSRWAKVLTMMQACISLGTVVILAARAVNIL